MTILDYVEDIKKIISGLPVARIERIVSILFRAERDGNRIYVMGNGGSATTASHIAGDLNKTCRLKAQALTDSNYLITGLANDEGYEEIFSKQLERLVQKNDVIIAISGSGNSKNILKGVETANKLKCLTIGLCGCCSGEGGVLAKKALFSLIVPAKIMEQVEDIHLMIGHILVTELKGI